MNLYEYISAVVDQVATWDGLTVEPHRFGGKEFKLGKVEIGHIHRNGMVDIPFTRAIRDVLLAENRAEHHHLLSDSGWISFYIRREEDIEKALWLYRLSYLQKGLRRLPDYHWEQIRENLQLSSALEAILFKD